MVECKAKLLEKDSTHGENFGKSEGEQEMQELGDIFKENRVSFDRVF